MIGLVLFATIAVQDPLEAAIAAAPPAVKAHIERRQGCNHWAGEEPYDKDRAREINAALRALRCDRIDRDEHRLRQRFAARADILTLLSATTGWTY